MGTNFVLAAQSINASILYLKFFNFKMFFFEPKLSLTGNVLGYFNFI